MGVDDYLVKPFALDEVVARLQALIRRSQGRSQTEIRYGDVSFFNHTVDVSDEFEHHTRGGFTFATPRVEFVK